jgi:hypothetical protein
MFDFTGIPRLLGMERRAHTKVKGSSDSWLLRKLLFALQVICVIYILITTFSPKPIGALEKDGLIRARETIMTVDWQSMVCLAISRTMAYSLYPPMVLLFFSKCHGIRCFLHNSLLSAWLPFYDLHDLHVLCGRFLPYYVWLHTLFHLLRWGRQGQIRLLYQDETGRSGVIAVLILPLITAPMVYEFLRKRIRWEWRKGLHYLCIPWAIAVAFHAPNLGVVMGVCLAVYALDSAYVAVFKTFKIVCPLITRLDCGTELQFRHPPGYQDTVGYIYLMVPWVSNRQWHAFSVYRNPDGETSSICITNAGDWTKALHESVKEPTFRPVWVQGPFPSPYSKAIDFDNLILVASGIGITPAMAVLEHHRERRVNLIWIVREPSLVEFFLEKFDLDEDAWNAIFYTGSKPLRLTSMLPPNVCLGVACLRVKPGHVCGNQSLEQLREQL